MSSSIPSTPERLDAALVQDGRQQRIILESLGIIAASLIFLIPHFHVPISDPDEGIIACGAERILRGQVPYRDFFSELGPASFYLHALFFKLGTISIFSLRLTAWLLGATITGLLYLLGRKILRPSWALAAAAIFPLVCYPLAYRISHHWWANLLLLLMTLVLSSGLARKSGEEGGPRAGRCAAAGALAGATLLAMQPKGFWAILMGVLFLWLEHWFNARSEHRLRRVLSFLGGMAFVLGLMAGYLASQGALTAWMDANLVFLFTNYRTYLDVPQASAVQTLLHIGRLALDQPSVHFSLYFFGYVFFFFVGPIVAVGGSFLCLWMERKNPRPESALVFLLVLQAAGGFLSEAHSPDIIHLIWGSPLILILFAWQCERLYATAPSWKRPLQIAGAGVMILVLFVAVRKAINTSTIDGRVETRRGALYVRPDLAPQTQAMIAAIEQRVPPGGETFFYPYMAEMYFLTATRNPTRYDVLLADFHRADQIEDANSSLQRAHPEFVFGFDRIQLLTIRPHFPDDPPDAVRPHPAGKALASPASGYRLETTVEEMEVWAAQP